MWHANFIYILINKVRTMKLGVVSLLFLFFVSSRSFALGGAVPPPRHLAILFSSFGDVESCSCVDSYWPNALAQLVNFEIPTPSMFKKWVGKMVWKQARNSTFAQYHAISSTCNTCYVRSVSHGFTNTPS